MIAFDDLAYASWAQEAFALARERLQSQGKPCVPGCVVSLDRGYPLVCYPQGTTRAELATTIKKSDDSIVAIGDWVALCLPDSHEKAVIESILPRKNEIARLKRAGREGQLRRQVLAANVDDVLICQSLSGQGPDIDLLVRQMVAVAGCGAKPSFVLTKADLVDASFVRDTCDSIASIAPEVPIFVVSTHDASAIDVLRDTLLPKTTSLLLGESGVGKSSLVNALVGQDALEVGRVRERDDKGRHTTVARRMLCIPRGGLIIDAPGLRTLQIIDMQASLKRAFPDIANAALGCRFRDCTHGDEPGCAVRDEVDAPRLSAYRHLLSQDGF